MRSLRVASVATLLTLSTLLTGCGGDDDGDDKDSKSDEKVTATVTDSPTTETAEPSETSASTEAPPMDPSDTDITVDQINAVLLTPAEVSPDFVAGTWSGDDSPPPCDPAGTPVDVAVPPAVESGTEMGISGGSVAMSEEIAIYDSEELANQAFELGTESLNCATATLDDGSTASIGAPQDVSGTVNPGRIGTSTSWEISGDGYKILLVATVSGRLLMANTFYAETDADTSTLPAPVDLAAAAFAKAVAS
jgi:hypothetical protein